MRTPWRLSHPTAPSHLLTFVLALAAPSQSPAASAAPDETFELTPVVVTARASQDPIGVTIDPRAPAQPIPAQDGADVLSGITGFNIVRKGGTHGDPVFRGLAGSRLGILLDGENTLGGCSNRMDPPTAYVFPANFDRITVLKGPQSVTYGAGYSAGIVLFERVPRRYERSETHATGSVTFGAFGRNDQMAEVRGGNPSAYFEVGANRTQSDDYEDGDGRPIHSAYKRWNTRAALGWTPDAATVVEFTGVVSDGEAAYADRMMDGAKFARRNAGLRFRRTQLAGWVTAVETSVFLNYADHVMDNLSLRPFVPSMMMPAPSVSNPDRLTLGGKAEVRLAPVTALRAKVGVDHQSNRHRLRGTSNQTKDPYERKPWFKDADFAVTGLFAETTWEVTPADHFIAGARLDLWHAEDHRPTVSTGMMSSAANPTAGADRNASLPSGFLRFEHECCSDFTFFAGVGHAQRFPDYWEMFAKETAASPSAFYLAPERTTQVDTGLTRRFGRVTASVSVFANRIDDFILVQSEVIKPSGMMGTRSTTIARSVDTRAFGGEATLTWKVTATLTADVALSAVHAENSTDHRPLAQQPPHEARVGLVYANSKWSVGTLARFVASQHRYALNQGNIVGQDLGPSEAFAVFSCNAAYKPARWLQVSVGLDNVFDAAYAEHLSRGGSMVAGFPAPTIRVQEPGRSGWVKFDIRY